jgi:hypothetical protein
VKRDLGLGVQEEGLLGGVGGNPTEEGVGAVVDDDERGTDFEELGPAKLKKN